MSLFDDAADALSGGADWLYEQLKAGPPGSPGRSTDAERDAYERGVRDAVAPVVNFVEKAAPEVKDAWDAGSSWVVEQAELGPPGSPARELQGKTPEEQKAILDAREASFVEAPQKLAAAAKETLTRGAKVLEFVTRPWVLAVIGGAAVLLIAAPYVTPWLSLAKGK